MTETLAATSQNTEISFVEIIRGELRYALGENRKFHRALILKDKRSTLGETNDKQYFWNSKDIAEKAKELKKDALSREDYFMLQNSLIKDEANINSFLEADGTLDGLTRDLSRCANPAIQLIAAGCCCNIALADRRVCALLAKAAGPYLIAELHTLKWPLLEVCAWTIGNLSAGSKSAFQVLYAQGCLRPLITLVDDCNDSVLSAIVYALKRCLYSGHDIITDTEVRDLTLALIRRGNISRDTETLWILALLSSMEASHEQLIFTIKTIFQLLCREMENQRASNIELITSGIRLLGNVICEPTGSAAEIFLNSSGSNDVANFFEKLLSHPRSYVQKETLRFLGNLHNHVQSKIRAKVRADLIPLLAASLKRFLSQA